MFDILFDDGYESDSSSSSIFDLFFDDSYSSESSYDDSYGYGMYDDSYDSGSISGWIEFIFFILIVIVVIVLKIKDMISKKSKKQQITYNENNVIQKTNNREINENQELNHDFKALNNVLNNVADDSLMQKEAYKVNVLRENGYNFDVELFKKWSRQIFECIKSGTEEQLNVIRNFMSSELYDKLKSQRELFQKDGIELVTEDLLIESCNLYDYGKSMSKEELKIIINAVMKEYIIQKSTNEVLRGSNKTFSNKNVIMTFTRKNVEEQEGLIHNCPNCGAEVVQTEFGKCRHCNTLVVPIRYNWTLTKVETA